MMIFVFVNENTTVIFFTVLRSIQEQLILNSRRNKDHLKDEITKLIGSMKKIGVRSKIVSTAMSDV